MAGHEQRAEAECGIDVAECQRRLGYEFRDPALLISALTHASGALHRLASNERLEFLGDAILGFLVCERLYRTFPDSLEGDLTAASKPSARSWSGCSCPRSRKW